MSTINISLPLKQVEFVDALVEKHGFANRSELIRSVLRLVEKRPHVVEEASTFPFVSPKGRSVKKIMQSFKKTGLYSAAFLKDLQEGLEQSEYFNK